MVKGNQQVLTSHWKKDWDKNVKTYFHVPARRQKRSKARKLKAQRLFPRPVLNLKPVVRCSGIKNFRERLGKGFSLQELKAANLDPRFARTVGISVDARRVNRNEEALLKNVQRLNEYKSKLVLYPLKVKKSQQKEKTEVVKKGKNVGKVEDTKDADKINVTQVLSDVLPVSNAAFTPNFRTINPEEKKFSAVQKLTEIKKALKPKKAKKDDKKKKKKKFLPFCIKNF